ncbi:MAG: hypothetical protein ACFFG0_53190, partial [Candidatus Thorarchaeota archaeon]
FGTKVNLTDGSTLNVERIFFVKEKSVIYNRVFFKNTPVYWIISKPAPSTILVQFCNRGTSNEIRRMIISQSE